MPPMLVRGRIVYFAVGGCRWNWNNQLAFVAATEGELTGISSRGSRWACTPPSSPFCTDARGMVATGEVGSSCPPSIVVFCATQPVAATFLLEPIIQLNFFLKNGFAQQGVGKCCWWDGVTVNMGTLGWCSRVATQKCALIFPDSKLMLLGCV